MALGLLNVHFWTSACHQDDILRNRLGNLLEKIEDKYYLISLLFDSKSYAILTITFTIITKEC